MGYFKALGWTLFGIFMFFGVIVAIRHLVTWVNKLFESLQFNPHAIIEFLYTVLGSDILVALFLALITFAPLIAYFVNE